MMPMDYIVLYLGLFGAFFWIRIIGDSDRWWKFKLFMACIYLLYPMLAIGLPKVLE